MLQNCLSRNPSASASSPHLYSTDDTLTATAASSTQPSPNLAREYSLAVQSDSYKEIRSTIQVLYHQHDSPNSNPIPILERVLHPNRDSVQDALRGAKPNTLTRLVSSYFDHSETTTHLCLHLQLGVFRARALYAPLHDLLDVLPDDSLSQSQCNRALEIFLEFDALGNPFPSPDSQDNFGSIRGSFSVLKQQLERRLRRSRSAIGFLDRVAFAARALAVAGPGGSCTSRFRLAFRLTHKEAQLDAAAKGTYVLNNDLDTIDRLVARLHSAIEGDKVLTRMAVESGGERHPIQEVLNQFRNNHLNFVHQLNDLEEHLCLCFSTVNRARALLLQQIYLHQTVP